MTGYITINKDIELCVDEILDEIGVSDILEQIGEEDVCNYLSNQYEDEELIELLDIRMLSPLDVDMLNDDECKELLWKLLKRIGS